MTKLIGHKVKGVTIMELLVALLITSIVATASFWGYQFLMQYYAGNVNYKERRLEEMRLVSNMSRMNQECNNIIFNRTENSLKFDDSESYLTIREDYVLLEQGAVDTFWVKCTSLAVEELTAGSRQLVSEFSFVLRTPTDSVKWEFSKNYSSEYLISHGF